MREISDALCREHNLTVIEHPKAKQPPRSLYFAEKQGEPTRYNLMRQTIDECIGVSSDFDYFLKSLIRRGYVAGLCAQPKISHHPGHRQQETCTAVSFGRRVLRT